MRLWNDYEGTTIADVYPIEKLIRPEGRSAFFSTSNGTGTPAVIRLIESINDESEILKRWETVAELKETHLVTLKKFGQTIFEGTPLIYVLMEKTEADLASILQEGTLSVEDTREIAISLVDAVSKLHAAGIVHEHIEPMNVMAAGEVVKLRSDCVREAPEGEEGIALMQKDVHDISVVLLQALTQRKSLETIGATRIPAPFDGIIRNGITGKWGLAQMAAALNPPEAKVVAAAAVATPAVANASASRTTTAAGASTTTATTPAAATKPEQIPLALPEAAPAATERRYLREDRVTLPVEDDGAEARRRWKVAVAPAAVMIVAALGWYSFHKPAPRHPVAPMTTLADTNAAPSGAASGNATPGSAGPAGAPSMAAPAPASTRQVPAPSGGADAPHWRVIAFTYNHQDQAQHKANELTQKNASLQPEVFTPHGRAPYLVTVGGWMSREDATAFRQKAAAEGLPRDIYIQNYGSKPSRRR